MYIVAVQTPRESNRAKQVLKELKPLAINGEIGWDVEWLFKIKEENWQDIVRICLKYTLNGTVLAQVDK